MKVLHIGYSDRLGGANIAMIRLHNSLRNIGVNTKVLVGEKFTNDKDIIGPKFQYEKKINDIKIKFARQKKYLYKYDGKYSHSLNIFKSRIVSKIDEIKPDIINLHWINNELMSIKDLSNIKLPIVWTFLDMWPMLGGEHYTDDNRYIVGYNKASNRKDEKGFDLNRYIWSQKKKYFKNKIDHIICISNWLKNSSKKSALFKDHNVSFIPCAIDIKEWFPDDKTVAREELKLPKDKIILLFLSTNGTKDYRKGYKFVATALEFISKLYDNIMLLNLGNNVDLNNNINNVFSINNSFNGDAEKLKKYYSACDILLTPSILEALGQVVIEAASCGVPSIGFKETGIADAVVHKKTGYLANYLDQEDFNLGLKWIINQIKNDKTYFKTRCQEFAKQVFSSEVIAKQYVDIYNKVLKK